MTAVLMFAFSLLCNIVFTVNNEIDAHYDGVLQLLGEDRFNEACEEYKKAIKLHPELLNICQTGHFREPHIAWERPMCEEVIRVDPKDADLHVSLGIILNIQGQWEEACEEFEKAIALNPNHANAHFNLGLILPEGQDENAFPTAFRALVEKTIELDPNHAHAHFNIAFFLRQDGRFKESLDALKKAIEYGLNVANGHYHFGDALYQQGRFDEARDQYKKAIELKPMRGGAHFNMGCLPQRQFNDPHGAREMYKVAIELDPEELNFYVTLGALLAYSFDDSDGAREMYKKAIQLQTWGRTTSIQYFNFGALLHKEGRFEEAHDAYKKAVKLDEKYPAHLQFYFGHLLHQDARFNEVPDEYGKAIKYKILTVPRIAVAVAVAVGSLTANKSFAKIFRKRKGSPLYLFLISKLLRLRAGFLTAIRGTILTSKLAKYSNFNA